MAKNTSSSAFRKIDIDQYNEDNFREDEAEQLIPGGKYIDALKHVLGNAPIGTSNQLIKDNALALTLKVLLAIKSAQIEEAVSCLSQDDIDILMKYIYRGFEYPSEGSSGHLLLWHEKAYNIGGAGSIKSIILLLVHIGTSLSSHHSHTIPVEGYETELHNLGEHVEIPETPVKVIKITKTVAVKIPVPYPVKVVEKVPYPVHVNKPYPVPVPHIVKAPYAGLKHDHEQGLKQSGDEYQNHGINSYQVKESDYDAPAPNGQEYSYNSPTYNHYDAPIVDEYSEALPQYNSFGSNGLHTDSKRYNEPY
ncbi:unnamed protein product [Leptosia nina]|uniref:Actin-related protein 2/3 complex subunit 5 n=1 Tax=Leptosia nina TaxID=320188 RepID=A0AAV1JL28_9NEOP